MLTDYNKTPYPPVISVHVSCWIASMLTNCLRFFIVPICLVVILPLMPTIALSQSTTETWFGWIESPEQQLRTIVRVQRDQTGMQPLVSSLAPIKLLSQFR